MISLHTPNTYLAQDAEGASSSLKPNSAESSKSTEYTRTRSVPLRRISATVVVGVLTYQVDSSGRGVKLTRASEMLLKLFVNLFSHHISVFLSIIWK